MAQIGGDDVAPGGAPLPLAEAQARLIAAHAVKCGIATVALGAASGRILAADLPAPFDLPPTDNSAVDGYAVHFDDLSPTAPTGLPVRGRAAAGAAPAGPLPRGEALRIFTGAVMPAGADTVMMQEDCTVAGDRVTVRPGIRRGANVRPAGEDIARGAVALAAGRRLMPPDIGLLAALGFVEVAVRAPLRVVLFSTGDEIVAPPARLRPGQVYDANKPMLAALLGRLGAVVTDGGILPDTPEPTRAALRAAAARADLVITSGGVSAGEEDHVRAAIEAVGTLEFWRVAMKPGRPVALGVLDEIPLLGLPGNPVAALITFTALGRPLLDRLAGATYVPPPRFAVRSGFAYRKKPGRREYVRVCFDAGGVARRYPKEGAGILTSLTGSDALMELPEELSVLAPGDLAPCIPLGVLLG
jgi:molybdopterin molybdotransferase